MPLNKETKIHKMTKSILEGIMLPRQASYRVLGGGPRVQLILVETF